MKKLILISLSALVLAGCNVETTGGATPTPPVSATPTITPVPSTTPVAGSVASLSFIDNNLQACVEATGVEMIRDLTSLTCINEGITYASDVDQLFYLESLNLSRNPIVNLSVGYLPLTTLNVSHLPGQGVLESLTLTELEQLTTLNVVGNKLTSLDTSELTNLAEVYFGYNQVGSVNFQANKSLATLHGQNNQLTSVTVANGPLTDVNLANNQLTTVDFPEPYSLRTADLSNNNFSQFPNWNLDNDQSTRNLETLNLSGNQLTNIVVPRFVDTLVLDNNQFATWNPASTNNLQTLSMANNQLESLFLPAGITSLLVSGNLLKRINSPTSVTRLEVDDNQIKSLSLHDGLLELSAAGNNISSLVGLPTGLTSLDISRNELIEANASDFLDLTSFTVDENALAFIDIDINTELASLSANATKLGEVVMYENTKLEHVSLDGNKLVALELPDITGKQGVLKTLSADNNAIVTVGTEFAGQTQLQSLSLQDNQIVDIRLDYSPVLESVDLRDNPLSSTTINKLESEMFDTLLIGNTK